MGINAPTQVGEVYQYVCRPTGALDDNGAPVYTIFSVEPATADLTGMTPFGYEIVFSTERRNVGDVPPVSSGVSQLRKMDSVGENVRIVEDLTDALVSVITYLNAQGAALPELPQAVLDRVDARKALRQQG